MTNNSGKSIESEAGNNIVKLALEGMKGAPWEARMILAILAIAIILLLTSIATAFVSKPEYGLISTIIGVAFLFYVVKRILSFFDRISPRIIWSRKYIDNIKSENLFQEVGNELDKLRISVSEIIFDITKHRFSNENIRINVFLPDCNDARDGYIFRLYMPTALRRNMERQQEWGIRFRPGQGSTGTCFLEGTRRITLSKDFRIDDEFKDSVHPDIKWIISYPLKCGQQHTLAVLNIDGLLEELSKEELAKIADACHAEVAKINKHLSKLPLAELVVEATNG